MSKHSHTRSRTTFARAAAALLALTLVRPLWAAPGDITQVPAPLIGADPPKPRDIKVGDASVSTQTGAFTYSYPIAVPPGRKGMQPALSLNYSSQAPNYGGIAMGWSLSLPEIKLDTSRSLLAASLQGIPFGEGPYMSTMAGGRPLVEVGEPGAATEVRTFRAQNDASFARYERMEESSDFRWRVYTLDGITHYFGDSSLAPASNYEWSPLTRMVDAYGNTIEYQWDQWELQQIRYTSNPSAGLPAFARVELDWTTGPQCTIGVQHVGAQEDAARGMIQGRRQLSKIRAVAQLPGGPIEHTREVSLEYSSEHARCDLKTAPMRVLSGIQESAWGPAAPRVDLPPVTFEYNRFERAFDLTKHETGPNTPWALDPNQHNLGWGTRPAAQWPTVNGMFLDFDGDGLLDRLFAAEPPQANPNECTLGWQRNRGLNADGNLTFDGPVYTTLPRLPWKGDDVKGANEWCSLSSQLTMKSNLPVPSPAPCQQTTGTYLVYRWMDLTGDELPDLVTAIHNDPNHFDPNASPWFGEWPSCSPDPACPALSAECMEAAVACPEPNMSCRFDHAAVGKCVGEAAAVGCDALMRQSSSSQVNECEATIGSDIDPNWCNSAPPGRPGPGGCPDVCSGDRLEPPHNGDGLGCDYKTPHSTCDRYPWMIYENKGNGILADVPQIKYQPLPLESDGGDSGFGAGNLSSPRHAIQDIDGDGNLDAVVRGRYTERELDIVQRTNWWLVFPGDGNGNFLSDSNGWPYTWVVPSRAPISGSCVSDPGYVCSVHRSPPVAAAQHDVKGLSTLIDLNGDGASDLVWKVAHNQFTSPHPIIIWEDVTDDDPIVVYRSNARQFEFRGSFELPEGTPLAWGGVQHFSRSSVTATTYTPAQFMSKGKRQSLSRFLDVDLDGRPDLLERSREKDSWEDNPSLFINGGGLMLPGAKLETTYAKELQQETVAEETGWSYPREYGWRNTKDLIDLDGDGIPEAWDFQGAPWYTWRTDSNNQPMRLMKRVDNGRGGTVDITYSSSANANVVVQDAAQRKSTPRPIWVVDTVSINDRWDSDTSKTTYKYRYPVWNESKEGDWGFRGFEEVETTLPSRARNVDTYGYAVDWSGRLSESRSYPIEQVGPHTVSETTWEPRTLFGGTITTYHMTHARSWTCANGQTEATCRNANSGFRHDSWTYQPLPLSGPVQIYYASESFNLDTELYGVDGRRSIVARVLHSDDKAYRLQEKLTASFQMTTSFPFGEKLTGQTLVEYDSEYKQRTSSDTYFDESDPTNHAVTSWTYFADTGLMETERSPDNHPSGPVTTFRYDATKRFATSVTNEVGHLVERTYDAGMGAVLWEGGPNSSSCGSGCTNREQRWTDIDGLGRPVGSHVNARVGASPVWQKTQVSRATYTDVAVGDARPHAVSESRIEYGANRWTREETRVDGLGRSVQVVVATDAGVDAVRSYDYDQSGNVVSVALPDPSENSAAIVKYSYGYDSLGRATSMRRPAIGGAVSSGIDMSYDGLVHRRDEVAGSQGGPAAHTELRHDNFGRLTEVREYISSGASAVTNYAYDANDRVRRVENADGVVTQLFHDMGGRRTRILRAGKTWTYSYYPGGSLRWDASPAPATSQTAAYTNTYVYDTIGRPKSRSIGVREMTDQERATLGVGTIELVYDTCPNGVGRLCHVALPGNVFETHYEYDAEGNRAKEAMSCSLGGIAGEWQHRYEFGPGGRVVAQSFADNSPGIDDGTSATYDYDSRAMPRTLRWRRHGIPGELTVASQTRNVSGLVTQRASALSATGWRNYVSTFSYDKLSRVEAQTVTDSGAHQVVRQQVDYFGGDDPRKLRHWMGTAYYELDFSYDARHHLEKVAEIGDRFSAGYSFTSAGKFDKVDVGVAGGAGPGSDVIARDVYYEYLSASDPEAVSAIVRKDNGEELREYEYDTVGNMVDWVGDEHRTSYLYDGENQLRRAVVVDGAATAIAEDYYYDHGGRRFAVVTRDHSNAVVSVRLFVGDSELLFDSAGGLEEAYAYLSLGGPVARVSNRAELELQYQGLAQSTILSVTPDGTTKSGFVYAPYGELIEVMGDAIDEQHHRFNGKYRDDATKLAYYGARYYDGFLLGWTQADPKYRFAPDAAWADPRRGLLWTFSGNNPVRYVDPDGRDFAEDAALLVAETHPLTAIPTALVHTATGNPGRGGAVLLRNAALATSVMCGGCTGSLVLGGAFAGAATLADGGSLDQAGMDMATAIVAGKLIGTGLKAFQKMGGQIMSKQAARQMAGGGGCFVAGTLVATGTGPVPIEEIAEGDLVWSADVETGEVSLRSVLQAFQRYDVAIFDVDVASRDDSERIQTTAEHPFWTLRGWVVAAELTNGDVVVLRDGRFMSVDNVRAAESSAAVYNLHVQEFSTYFVGRHEILVHNNSATKPGVATVMEHRGVRGPHFTVSVKYAGAELHTEQVILDAAMTRTTIAVVDDAAPVLRSVDIPLPDGGAAMRYQQSVLGKATGPYQPHLNSCLHHCADVARAGGVEGVPTRTKGIASFLRKRAANQ